MKTVIEMAIEAGAIPIHKDYKQRALVGNENLERFAELVRADAIAAEREACARVCDDWAKTSYLSEAKSCAKIIRNRSTT